MTVTEERRVNMKIEQRKSPDINNRASGTCGIVTKDLTLVLLKRTGERV